MMLRIVIGLGLLLIASGASAAPEKTKTPKTDATAPSAAKADTLTASAKGVGKSVSEAGTVPGGKTKDKYEHPPADYAALLFVFALATIIGIGVVARVSRLLHTPLMSLTNAISAIAVVGSIIVTGSDYPLVIRMMGFVALIASMTNVVSGFMITDRMLKMFKQTRTGEK